MNQESQLIEILMSSPAIGKLLRNCDKINLPDWYIAAGAIPTVVWNTLTGNPADRYLSDVDIVYFDDRDLSESAEAMQCDSVREAFDSFPYPLDIKNQARVHLWYRDKHKQPIKAYMSTEEGIDMWLSVTAIGVRCIGEDIEIYAPYGLDDLFAMYVRPNRCIISQDHYDQKVKRWKKQWPAIRTEKYYSQNCSTNKNSSSFDMPAQL